MKESVSALQGDVLQRSLRVAQVNWRFVLRPRWIVGHLIIVGMVILMMNLALWQLHRLHGREAANSAIRSAMVAPMLTLTSAETQGLGGFRHVEAEGTWVSEDTVYVRYPIVDSLEGYYVLTPLRLDGGEAVIVNRGWIPVEQGRNASLPSPSSGVRVHVAGLLQDGERSSGRQGQTGGRPGVPTLTSVDMVALRGLHPDLRLAPGWIQLLSPAGVGDPKPLELPVLDKGPHLSYTLQWTGFSIIAIVGWAILLYKMAREEGGASRETVDEPRL